MRKTLYLWPEETATLTSYLSKFSSNSLAKYLAFSEPWLLSPLSIFYVVFLSFFSPPLLVRHFKEIVSGDYEP